jgi:hypothetical protein
MSYTIPNEAKTGRSHRNYKKLLEPKYNNINYNQMVMDLADAKWDSLFKFGVMAPRNLALAYLLGAGINFDLSQHVAGSGFVGADHYDHSYYR